tara:strand:+ start:583 stop:1785 length:1203 start_codon:yes stop_codon:yes gene_type:complete
MGILQEKLILKSYDRWMRFVAKAYKARPNVEKTSLCDRSYKALLAHTLKFYKKLSKRIKIEFVDYDAYKNAAEMTADIDDNKVLRISKMFSENLLSGWSPRENWIFRAVHDYVIHYGGKHNFSMRGEISSYNRHAKLIPVIARPALFSEVVGQAAYFTVYGKFPEIQKKCILYGFDYVKVGKIDVQEYKKNYSPEFGGTRLVRESLEMLEAVSRKEKAKRLAKKKAREHLIPPEDKACPVVLPQGKPTVGVGADEREILSAAKRALKSIGTVSTIPPGHHFFKQLHHKLGERGAMKPDLGTAEVVRFFSRLPRAKWFDKIRRQLRSMKPGVKRSVIIYDLSTKISVPMTFTRNPSPDPKSDIVLNTVVRTRDPNIGRKDGQKVYAFCTAESLMRTGLNII